MRDAPTNATTEESPSTRWRNTLHHTGSSTTVGRWPCARVARSSPSVIAATSAAATSQVAPQRPPGIARGSELEVDEGTVGSLHEDDGFDRESERDRARRPRRPLDDVLERALAGRPL